MNDLPVTRLVQVESICHAVHNVHKAGYVFEGHMHSWWELVYVKSGKAIVSSDEEIFHLKKGMLFFHKPLQFHQIMTDGNENVELLILDFNAFGKAMRHFPKKCYILNNFEFEAFLAAFKSVSKAGDYYTEDEYEIFAAKAAVQIELFLLNLLDKQPYLEKTVSTEEEHYKTIVSVMNENCCEKLSLKDIALICNMSVSNLKRIFHMFNSVGIAKYMTTLKIQRAAEMLTNGNDIKYVAEKLNFSSVNYFQNVFKKELKMTPGQYRNKHLPKNHKS